MHRDHRWRQGITGWLIGLLALTSGARAAVPPSAALFGAFPDAAESVNAYNISFTSWLLDGIQATEGALARLSSSTQFTSSDLSALQAVVRGDATRVGNEMGPKRALAQAATDAQAHTPALESVLLQAPDAASRRQAEQNLIALRQELGILDGAQQRVAIYAKRLEELDTAFASWIKFWRVTESARGAQETRRQLAELVAQESRRWGSLYRREITESLLARGRRIPDGLPARLQEAFRDMEGRLPRFSGSPHLYPTILHPLVSEDTTNGVSVLFDTSQEMRARLTITPAGGNSMSLDVSKTAPGRYRAVWHPPFLADESWLADLGTTSGHNLGQWDIRIELWSDPESAGCEVLVDATNLPLIAIAAAPHGSSLAAPPKKSKLLRKYAREADIPLENRHHFIALLTYPILGLPRDLVDAVFGAVDKIPYVSLPINLVYAGPGQLICKPWWDGEYKPFAQQSAGYYAWGGWDPDRWQYFENARTWYWPKNDGASFLSGIVYLGLGLPRDIVDIPFGWLDQVPFLSTPISYVYEPLTIATKPWYAERYTAGRMEGQARVRYCEQSKHVVCLGDWWERSQWVFFENYRTTTFRSPNVEKQQHLRQRHRDELASYEDAARAVEQRNYEIRSSCTITLQPPGLGQLADQPVPR